ncbi:MAG TPA: protein-glutamate O-methyltransferase CheR [Bacillota bacterium]|nr:protein-glutamate O-methyltransferase CheR [Bacillota bacterium]HOR85355.1 protein-glutamate O-methyltransferase CheR [Bacillota bacterium]HPL54167.1 protein-glutamate O-methyltransferase CheR [Bacillota bacterium]
MLTDYEGFKVKVLKLTGINLSCYKERQMKRRIDSLIRKNNYDDYDNYFRALVQNPKLYDEFINYLTINVSEFYRNPTQWEILEKEIMPGIIKPGRIPKIWSAACSTGEEPYSLAMMMSRLVDISSLKILATDIDDGAIEKAMAGVYSSKSLENLPKEFISNYFTKEGEKYKISDKIKSCIKFEHHNLLEDKYPEKCDLIVCRNVMIYFTEEAKATMHNKFRESLNDNGVLFVGSTEQIILPQRYKLAPLRTFFYKRSGQA